MNKKWFEIIGNMISYVFDLKIVDIPEVIAYLGLSGLFGYCAAMIIIGFPVTVWEYFTKKKVRQETESKAIATTSVFLAVAMILRLLYEQVT